MNENCKFVIEKMISYGWTMIEDGLIDIKEYRDGEYAICMFDKDAKEHIVDIIVKKDNKYKFKYVSKFFAEKEDALEYFNLLK